MAPLASATASYKKQDGLLAMSQDGQSVSWTPKNSAGSVKGFTIQIANLSHLQQTPITSPKVMLKIFAHSTSASGTGDAADTAVEQYVFSFTSPTNPRAEADSIRDVLNAGIQAKAAQASAAGGRSAAMAIASAVTSGANGKPIWHDDSKLKADADLQQSLLKADPNLQRVLLESLRNKPESVTPGQFVSQFWSSRVHLLRAHAIERSQARGPYNVLSSLKPRVENSVAKLNISKEQIQLIFTQHPLVKKVYDENVPKLTEEEFWSRFFQSRIFKKLRGERITDSDATDSLLDKYLRADEHEGRDLGAQVPHIIDLEANEENVRFHGNRPNFDMRPSPLDKVPIIRTLNHLSEKIMANVAPIDRDPSAPVGMDEETFNQLQLRDLRGEEEQERMILSIKDQSRFFAASKESESEEARIFAKQDPPVILKSLRNDLRRAYPDSGIGIPLSQLVEPDEDDSDQDEAKPKKELVGSKSSLASASTQIFAAIHERLTQVESASNSQTCGLSQKVFDRLTLTHATTTEFLHQFWQVFLSGNPDRVSEIASLVESLNRAMDRIKAVADEAESERIAEIDRRKKEARELMAATKKSVRPNLKVEGGQKVVNQLMGPTIKALGKAIAEYRTALAEQTKNAGLVQHFDTS